MSFHTRLNMNSDLITGEECVEEIQKVEGSCSCRAPRSDLIVDNIGNFAECSLRCCDSFTAVWMQTSWTASTLVFSNACENHEYRQQVRLWVRELPVYVTDIYSRQPIHILSGRVQGGRILVVRPFHKIRNTPPSCNMLLL